MPAAGRFLTSGRSHPDSREGPMAAQAWYVYDCIRENLASQGLAMDDIVHVNAFLQDIRDVGTFHRVHRHFFPGRAPALTVSGFNEVGHRGTRIEIELTAVRPTAGFAVQHIG